MSSMAVKRLASEFNNIVTRPTAGLLARPVSEGDMFTWTFALQGPPDSDYEHGVFTGKLHFPKDYPLSPPKMSFEPSITHPNVGKKGDVCISILHSGVDATGYERPEERWSPVQSVTSILLSVLSMLAEPNVESPANVDAAKLYLSDKPAFQRTVRAEVERSLGLAGGSR